MVTSVMTVLPIPVQTAHTSNDSTKHTYLQRQHTPVMAVSHIPVETVYTSIGSITHTCRDSATQSWQYHTYLQRQHTPVITVSRRGDVGQPCFL